MMFLLIVIFMCLVIVIGLFTLLYVYQQKTSKDIGKTLKDKHFVPKTFVINLNTRKVVTFNLTNLEERTTIMYPKFLDMFDKQHTEAVKKWIEGLVDNPNSDELADEDLICIANEAIIKKSKRIHLTKVLIKCTHVDHKNKKIYLDIYTLRNSPTAHITKKNQYVERTNIYPIDVITKEYHLNTYNRGALFIINFSIQDVENPSVIDYARFRYIVMDSLNKQHDNMKYKFFDTGNVEQLTFIDLHNDLTKDRIKKYIKVLKGYIEAAIEVCGYTTKLDYHIFGSFVNQLPAKLTDALAIFERFMSLEKDDVKKYNLYEKNDNSFLFSSEGYAYEIDKLLKYQALIVQYRPIVELSGGKVTEMGYMSFVKPSARTIFKSIEEIKKFVILYEKQEDFLTIFLKLTLDNFIKERDKSGKPYALFIDIDFDAINIISDVFDNLKMTEKSSIVFSFKSSELMDNEDDGILMGKLRNLKSKGYDIALETNSNDYVLQNTTYGLFDYFIFNTDFGTNLKINSTDFLRAHQFLDRLVKYGVPIISSDAPNMQTIDLFYKAGITYFSSDAISPKSFVIKSIDKKVIKRLTSNK